MATADGEAEEAMAAAVAIEAEVVGSEVEGVEGGGETDLDLELECFKPGAGVG